MAAAMADRYARDTDYSRRINMDLHHRAAQSIFSRLLQIFLRPIKPILAAPMKVFPEGSVRLQPPDKSSKGVEIEEWKLEDLYVYDVRPREAKAPTRMRLYYVAGGGWRMPPSGQHWKLAVELVNRVPGLVFSMVSVPLAPKSTASTALPQLNRFYAAAMARAASDAEIIVFGGDSSGANIALGITLYGLLEKTAVATPAAVLLISPSVDLREMKMEGDIPRLVLKDPMLTLRSHNGEADVWAQDEDRDSPWVSPVNVDGTVLADAGVNIFGITAGHDILTPDALKFRDLCIEGGVRGTWLHWDKQMHCFPIAFSYGLKEAVASITWIVDQLKTLQDLPSV